MTDRDRWFAACAVLGYLAHHQPDLVQDAITACRHMPGALELARIVLIDQRADTIKAATR